MSSSFHNHVLLCEQESAVGNSWLKKMIPKSPADYCGLLSLLWPVPYLGLAAGLFHFPDWMLPAVLWGFFLCPLAGIFLALFAALKNRWWLVLAAVWLGVLLYEWWYMAHHPFDL